MQPSLSPGLARTFSRTDFTHRPLKAQLASELSAAASDEEKASVRAEFEARERILEHEIDFTPRELSMALQVNYSKLGRFARPARSARAHSPILPSQQISCRSERRKEKRRRFLRS